METKPIAYTFSTSGDEWILLPTAEGHALILVAEIVQVTDLGDDGKSKGGALVVVQSEQGWQRSFVAPLRTEAIARLLQGEA